jgi:hypothetical protein
VADVVDLQEVDDAFLDVAAQLGLFAARAAQVEQASSTLVRRCAWRPSLMLSSTVMPRNSAMFWKLRPRPSRALRRRNARDVLALERMLPPVGR